MTATLVLSASWDSYEQYKFRNNLPADIFCADNPFEINFLIDRLHEAFPGYTDISISLAIHQASRECAEPVFRKKFVHAVVRRLLEKRPFIISDN